MNLARLVPTFYIPALVAAGAILTIGACAPSFPLVATTVRGDAELKTRIATSFPSGSSALGLRSMLAAEGFRLIEDRLAGRYSAIDAPPNLPCFSTTRIDWTENRRGRIILIQASRHTCS